MKSLYDRLPVEDYEDCPSNSCPRIFVNINEGDLTDCECIDRAYDKYKRTVTVSFLLRDRKIYPINEKITVVC